MPRGFNTTVVSRQDRALRIESDSGPQKQPRFVRRRQICSQLARFLHRKVPATRADDQIFYAAIGWPHDTPLVASQRLGRLAIPRRRACLAKRRRLRTVSGLTSVHSAISVTVYPTMQCRASASA